MFKGWLRRWAGSPPEPEPQPEGASQPLDAPLDEQLDSAASAGEGDPGAASEPAASDASDLGTTGAPPAAAVPEPGPAIRGVLTINDRRYAAEALGPEGLELVRLIQATDGLMQRRRQMLATLKRARLAQELQLQELLASQVALPPLEAEGP